MKRITILLLFACTITGAFAQDITGKWYGWMEGSGIKLRVGFEIEQTENGYTAKMTSPDQTNQKIPVSSVALEDSMLKINILQMMFGFQGVIKSDSLIEGKCSQMGQEFTLNLTRTEVRNNRPQTPQEPFPYLQDSLMFENKEAGIKLGGTLTMPDRNGPFPAVILVSGSGAQDRDEHILGHKPFAVLADYLTRRGIAVLRYDDRGVGASEGIYREASIADFASDARAAIAYLRQQPNIRKDAVGIIGHSEGGSIALMLAADQTVDFAVSMAGMGINGSDLLVLQREALLKASGMTDEYIKNYNELMAKSETLIFNETDSAKLVEQIRELYAGTVLAGQEELSIRQLNSPELRSVIQFDPSLYFPKIKCPLLALNGGKDLQVTPTENLGAIHEGVPHATVRLFPELNHLFQTAKTGNTNEYAQIEETINPEVLSTIAAWIVQLTRTN